MTREEEQCLALGRRVVRMIRDLATAVKHGDCGYALQNVTFPGGSVELIVSTKEVADLLDDATKKRFDVAEATPASELN